MAGNRELGGTCSETPRNLPRSYATDEHLQDKVCAQRGFSPCCSVRCLETDDGEVRLCVGICMNTLTYREHLLKLLGGTEDKFAATNFSKQAYNTDPMRGSELREFVVGKKPFPAQMDQGKLTRHNSECPSSSASRACAEKTPKDLSS